MIISTKGRYALRVMIDLAEHPTDGYTPLQEIARRQAISKEYLNSILKVLVEKGLLDSLRGKGGGYRLKLPPEQCSIGDILRGAEGDLSAVSCAGPEGGCPNAEHCRSYRMWQELDGVIAVYLDSIRLVEFLPGGRFYPGSPLPAFPIHP